MWVVEDPRNVISDHYGRIDTSDKEVAEMRTMLREEWVDFDLQQTRSTTYEIVKIALFVELNRGRPRHRLDLGWI
jgi:hypothetical protein